MAEKLCTLRTKGGGGDAQYTETSLWTNQSPTGNFSGQNVTLSDSIDNYKYVSIKYRASISVADEANVIVLVSDLKKSVGHNSTNHIAIETGAQYSSGTIISRMVTYVNSTTIGFSMAYQLNAATSNAGWAIPLEILGLNELKYKPDDYMVVTGSVNVSLGSTVTVDLGFKPKKLTVWRVSSSTLGTMAYYDEDISSSTYTRMYVNGSGSNANSARGLPDTNTNGLSEITDNGFKVSATSTGIAGVYNYTAIGIK